MIYILPPHCTHIVSLVRKIAIDVWLNLEKVNLESHRQAKNRTFRQSSTSLQFNPVNQSVNGTQRVVSSLMVLS